MKHLLVCCAIVGLSCLAEADTVTIHAKDVVALTNALTTYKTSAHTIQLEAGDYDLTGIRMESDATKYGDSHLLLSGVKLVGLGESRDDVRLIGDGTCRIMRVIPDTYAVVRNLTITNGYAKTVSGAAESGHGGGIYGYPTVTNCVISGCNADGYGGAAHGYTYLHFCALLNNSANSGGATYRVNEVINCLVKGNHATGGAGGINGNCYGKVLDSVIVENTSGGSGAGIASSLVVSNCHIALNVAVGNGGGMSMTDVSGYLAVVTDCTICSNKSLNGTVAIYGGGIHGGTLSQVEIRGGSIFANYARHGGGASYCKLAGVDVHDNYAESYGGGLYGCTATGCALSHNIGVTGANANGTTFVGCDISGTGLQGGTALGCRFHDIYDNAALRGNPYKEASWTGHGWAGVPVCTNCLFHDIRLLDYSRSLFCGDNTPSRSMQIVNCTIVSNRYGKTFNYTTSETYPAKIVNSVFVWNQGYNTTSFQDIHAWENVASNGMSFVNCAYGTATGRFAKGQVCYIDDCADGPLYQFGKNGFPANPRFMLERDPENPFALRRHSPLSGIGAYSDWMASATDIRGEGYPRATEGQAVDIGCYQCWLPAPGMLLLFR